MLRCSALYIYTGFLLVVVSSTMPLYKSKRQVSRYLEKYGYYYSSSGSNETNELETALRLFQRGFHLNQSGKIDDATLKAMNTPRCAQIDGKLLKYRPTARKFAVKVDKNMNMFQYRSKLIALVHRAYKTWNEISNISFYEAIGNSPADMHISFTSGKDTLHPYEVVNATYPTHDGFQKIVINEHAPFLVTPYFNRSKHKKGSDFSRVLLHSIGHNLGFSHSYRNDSLMYPLFPIVKRHRRIKISDKELSLVRELYGNIWSKKSYKKGKQQYVLSRGCTHGRGLYLICICFFVYTTFKNTNDIL